MSLKTTSAAIGIAGLIALAGAPTAFAQSTGSGSGASGPVIDSFTTTDHELGTIYNVTPTAEGRSMGSAALSHDPAPEMTEKGIVATPSVVDQFRCHAVFAASKAIWNLEDFRPHVGWPAYISSQCNPAPVAQ